MPLSAAAELLGCRGSARGAAGTVVTGVEGRVGGGGGGLVGGGRVGWGRVGGGRVGFGLGGLV